MMKLLFVLIFLPSLLCAQEIEKRRQQAFAAADAIEAKCIQWRRDLHQHPELGNREFRTGRLIAEHLKKLGMEVQYPVAKTGVVAVLKGGKPGPCIALRADMDALPVKERTDVPFASKVKAEYNGQQVDVMHACGHDTHVAILMSVAEILSKMKGELSGTVKFIFQPAEEGPPAGEEGGAMLMVKEGVMEQPKVDAIFGLHISATTEVGTIRYKPGAMMASSDWFTIRVKGKGAHGSAPWQGIDPIYVSSQIINGLQGIVSRQSELTKGPVVITVGKIQSGVRNNIIPEECVMDGTIRTLDNAMQQKVHEEIRQTAQKIAEASGATAEVIIDTKTLVTYNSPSLTSQVIPSLQAASQNVTEMEWTTGAEDFSYYGEKAPAFFFYIGGMPKGTEEGSAAPHHTADFYVDESGMKTGIRAFLSIVIDYLK